jgi:phasin family protein
MPATTSTTSPDSPLGHAMESARTATEEFTRLFSQLKLPALPDAEALMQAHQRNIEALSAANRVALEGAQAVARRHMEIMQQTMGELTETIRALGTTDTPQAKAARQAELLKQAYERAMANARELSDLIQRSNGEALAVLNRRFTEAMDEVKALMEKASKAG